MVNLTLNAFSFIHLLPAVVFFYLLLLSVMSKLFVSTIILHSCLFPIS